MIGKKRIGLTALAVATAGTAVAIIAMTVSPAHAQSAASISITGMAQAGTAGSPEPEVLVSVTCPAGAQGQVSVTAAQGGFYAASSSLFTCTGSPQSKAIPTMAISGSTGFIFAGPVSAGAALWIGGMLSQDVGTTAAVVYP